jgi:hypothetical protein
MIIEANKAVTPTIESEEFYNLMQAYRVAGTSNQMVAIERFGAIVAHIDAKLAAHDDLVRIATILTRLDASEGLSPAALVVMKDWASKALAKAGAA